ncbi:hypothetical protein LLH23_09510 [bacterium]|nr:hypothetical protein [bacterium]
MAGLRLPVLLLLVLALINPAWQRTVRVTSRPHLTILLDSSGSMGLPAAQSLTRGQQAAAALRSEPVRRELARFDHATVPFTRGLGEPPSPRTEPGGTDLALALQQVAARGGADPGPVLIVSDGAETEGQAQAAAAQLGAAGRSVFTAGVGPTRPSANVGPVAIQAPRTVRERQPVPVRALVRATGLSGAQPVHVQLDGKTIATLAATLSPDTVAAVKCQLPGLAAGMHVLTVKAPARSDEATAADNERSQLIEARRDVTRLVLLAGAPDPDYAALRRLLGRLPKLQTQAFVRLGPGRFLRQQGDKTAREAPNLPRLLREAHAVLLMNYPIGGEATALRGFVQGGGSLGWCAGRQATGAAALGPILPARLGSAYTPMLTPVAPPRTGSELGEVLLRAAPAPWWRGAPFLEGVTALSGVRPGADTVLPAAGGRALLVTGTFGTGATLLFGGAGTHRWLLSAEADEESRRLYEVFWQSVIGWLSQPREQRQLVVMLDPAIAPEGQPVRLLAACGQTGATLRAEISGAGQRLAVPLSPSASEPGRYAATVSALKPGKYSVRFVAQAGGAALSETRQLVIERGGVELSETVQQVGVLQAIAAAGRGRYAPLDQLASLLAQIPATPASQGVTQAEHPFRSGAVLGVAALLLCVEWWLRRRWG